MNEVRIKLKIKILIEIVSSKIAFSLLIAHQLSNQFPKSGLASLSNPRGKNK
jgi:hypothetical protein